MAQYLASENYEAFVREKRAAAVHFDAEWDTSHRVVMQRKRQEAEAALSEYVNFGQVDVDREIPLAKSVQLIGIPAVECYIDGRLVTVLLGAPGHLRALASGVKR